ncbi:hypothetical protein DPD44_24090 [Salmonella enterica subsp. enterica serovar Poona]|nr:hypothetical protein [Salmonella enterica subsp. enterica serovar Poona]
MALMSFPVVLILPEQPESRGRLLKGAIHNADYACFTGIISVDIQTERGKSDDITDHVAHNDNTDDTTCGDDDEQYHSLQNR